MAICGHRLIGWKSSNSLLFLKDLSLFIHIEVAFAIATAEGLTARV